MWDINFCPLPKKRERENNYLKRVQHFYHLFFCFHYSFMPCLLASDSDECDIMLRKKLPHKF